MYVDESGSDELNDYTPFFVISGVIFHEQNLSKMKKTIQEYKENNFIDSYKDAEIHVYDMYNSYGDFEDLHNPRKQEIIDELYRTINQLPVTIISVGIDKWRFMLEGFYDRYGILDMAYKMLIERFDNFLRGTQEKGLVRIDRTTCKTEYKPNARDRYILDLIIDIRKHGTGFQTVRHIAEEPLMVDSSLRKGLQVADAVAYCTTRFLLNKKNFLHYWDLIQPKIRCNSSGNIFGYGLRIFPYK